MPEPSTTAAHIVRFGLFELNLRSGELRKAGTRINLQEQPLRVLTVLLDRAGDLVTREELRERLWAGDTFVDFDHGLNAVINRLRDTLGDSADSPRFIETVPRRGYRFIADVERQTAGRGATGGPTPPDSHVVPHLVLQPDPHSAGEVEATRARRAGSSVLASWIPSRSAAIGAVTVVALSAAMIGAWLLRPRADVDGGPPRLVPLTNMAGTEDWPAFAPDGEQVAFAWSGEKYDNTDIYVTLVGALTVRRVTTDAAEDYAPSWSPDGRRIAFLRKHGTAARIHGVSALGGPDAKLSDFPVGATVASSLIVSHITWSPDGRYVVAGRDPRSASGAPAGIHLIPIEGGEPRAITRPTPPSFDFSPAFSPDGRHLAYASCETAGLFLPQLAPDNCAIRVVAVDATLVATAPPRTLTSQPVDPAGFAWSRDGRSILFVGPAPRSVYLWRLWVDGSRAPEPIQIAGRKAQHPATVASRDRLVFTQYDWDAHLYRFNGGSPAERVAASSSFEGDPHFSPDGRRLAFTSGRSGSVAVWVAAADGSDARQITHGQWVWPGSPSWSPDGRVIAFDGAKPGTHVRIWTVDAEGGTPRQITNGPGDQTVPRWSHDGRWIYFSNHGKNGRDIWRVRPTGGEPEQVTRGGSGFVAYESVDGSGLIYQSNNGDSPLLLLPLAGAAPPRTLAECVRSAAFATAGREVFYVPCSPGLNPPLHAVDVMTGEERVLGNLQHFPPDVSHVSLAVSPDGEVILFRGMVRKGGDLMLVENFR